MYENLKELENSMKDCKKCKLCHTRKHIVFGQGNPNADMMLIGEGPRWRRRYTRNTIYRKSREAHESML